MSFPDILYCWNLCNINHSLCIFGNSAFLLSLELFMWCDIAVCKNSVVCNKTWVNWS
jgi:hypothetical protein